MRFLLRLVALTAYVGGGYLVGHFIGRLLLIPLAGTAHIDTTLHYGVTITGGVLGAISGLGWFNAQFPLAAARGGVHGSAHFADARQVQASLGGGAGLIVGRENRRAGKLLEHPDTLLDDGPLLLRAEIGHESILRVGMGGDLVPVLEHHLDRIRSNLHRLGIRNESRGSRMLVQNFQ